VEEHLQAQGVPDIAWYERVSFTSNVPKELERLVGGEIHGVVP
jgi:hypothetical protein